MSVACVQVKEESQLVEEKMQKLAAMETSENERYIGEKID